MIKKTHLGFSPHNATCLPQLNKWFRSRCFIIHVIVGAGDISPFNSQTFIAVSSFYLASSN
jgi:hypothetical protein